MCVCSDYFVTVVSEVDLLGSVDVKVKVEVGIANCSNLENFQRLVQRGFISNEFETSVVSYILLKFSC